MRFEFLRLFSYFNFYKKIYFIFIFLLLILVNFCWVGVVGVVKTPRMSTYHIICAVLYVLYGTYLYHTVYVYIFISSSSSSGLYGKKSHHCFITCDEHFLVSISTR